LFPKHNLCHSTHCLSDALLKAISKKGTQPLLQYNKKAIPPILEGKDVLASAQTGTGKTAGFIHPYYKHYRRKTLKPQTYSCLNINTNKRAAQILAQYKRIR
jgi:ATP-dependent RNA helicase RhlE